MAPVLFEIDRTKKGGRALYELLITSTYATLIKQKNGVRKKQEYTFNDLNETSKKAFADADAKISKEQMFAKIDKGIQEFKQGKSKKLDVSKINSFLGI